MKHRATSITKLVVNFAKKPLPKFLFLSDDQRIKNPAQVIKGLGPNCGVILRDYNNPNRTALIKTVIKQAKQQQLSLFIANSGDNVVRGAHNQHWPNTGRGGQRRHARHQIVTTSAHNLGDLGRANRLGVDAVLISPVFTTKSHPDKKPLNIHRFARFARLAKMPVYALGGISAKSAKQLLQYKIAHGIAGISLFK